MPQKNSHFMRVMGSKIRNSPRFYVFEWPPHEEDLDPMKKVWDWTAKALERRLLREEFRLTPRSKIAAMLHEDLESIFTINYEPLMRKQISQTRSNFQKIIDSQGGPII